MSPLEVEKKREIDKIRKMSPQKRFWLRLIKGRSCLTCLNFNHETLKCSIPQIGLKPKYLFELLDPEKFPKIGNECAYWR